MMTGIRDRVGLVTGHPASLRFLIRILLLRLLSTDIIPIFLNIIRDYAPSLRLSSGIITIALTLNIYSLSKDLFLSLSQG